MSTFDEIMKQPLPSKRSYMESADDLDTDDTFGIEDEAETSALDAEDEMMDDEVDALADELNVDDEDVSEDDLADGEDEVDLSPEEEMHADDLMSVAATTVLVDEEMNDDEKEEFIANDAETAVAEGFMTDSDVNLMAYNLGLVQENNYNKPMIIRLDAEAKKKQLYALAVNVSAAAKNDPDYVKLKKIMRVRKVLRAKLDRKYHSVAIKRMKIYFARLRRSKSQALNKLGHKMDNK